MNNKQKENLFEIGNIIIVKTKYYAKKSNIYLDNINSSSKRYTKEEIKNDILNKKLWRPLIILWSNDNLDNVICSSTTTQKPTKKMQKFHYSKKQYWNYNVIIINKKDIKNIKNHIFENVSLSKIEKFVSSWPLKYSNSYTYLIEQINSFEKEIN